MERRTEEALVQLFFALRALADSGLASLGVKEEEVETEVGCEHPLDRRKMISTMGEGARWQCGICGAEFEEATEH